MRALHPCGWELGGSILAAAALLDLAAALLLLAFDAGVVGVFGGGDVLPCGKEGSPARLA